MGNMAIKCIVAIILHKIIPIRQMVHKSDNGLGKNTMKIHAYLCPDMKGRHGVDL